ncbi:MAG TPA: DNA polymerase III subunit beta [Sphingobium sp.]|uniref:DNA polymerase III subunit beta n=1 Tax=Sphingobium sp. TaxID=1912891 RepID=UPI002ED556F9
MTAKTKTGSITIEVKALREVMQRMVKVVERRNTIPILSDVLLRSGPSTMTVIATDLDVELVQQVDLVESGTNASFTICVNAQSLNDIARKLPDGAQAKLTLEDGKMKVEAGRSRFNLPTLPPEDFPSLVSHQWAAQFEMDKGNLTALFASTSFAVSTEETRYYLNGVYLHVDGGTLYGAATDGHRLARFHCEAPEGAEGMPGIIVARKTVKIVEDLLDEIDGPRLDISLSRTKIHFAIGTVELTAKLIDGTFPDYTRVIPISNNRALWVNPRELALAIDRVAVITTDKYRQVTFDLDHDVLTLRVISPEFGTATEDLPCRYEAEPMSIGLNSRFVIGILRQLTGENAQILFGDAGSPTLWRDDEEARRLFVCMPLKAA